jgi:hypothetical protein
MLYHTEPTSEERAERILAKFKPELKRIMKEALEESEKKSAESSSK